MAQKLSLETKMVSLDFDGTHIESDCTFLPFGQKGAKGPKEAAKCTRPNQRLNAKS